MKKFICLVITIMLLFTLFLTSCEKVEEYNNVEVSTISELKKVGSEDNVILKNDIDCEYDTVNSLNCHSFDGQGFTISNLVISGASLFSSYSYGTAYGVSFIKNINFNNITLNSEGNENVGIVLDSVDRYIISKNSNPFAFGSVTYGYGTAFDNIKITNSVINATMSAKTNLNVGTILGNAPRNRTVNCEVSETSFINCAVEDVEINVKGCESSYSDMAIGGILGNGENLYINKCITKECKITSESKGVYDTPYVGGIVGKIEDQDFEASKIENSYVVDNTLEALAKFYNKGSFSLYSTAKIYMGGIVSYIKSSGEIRYCFSENNKLYANSTGDIFVGGFIGYVDKLIINQSYSKSTLISMTGYAGGNKNSVTRCAGGFIAFSNNNSCASCFAYNDRELIEHSSGFKNTSDSQIAGLIAIAKLTSIRYCAVFNINLVSSTVDEFIPSSVNNLQECYVSNTKFGNINNCDIVTDAFWYSPNSIKHDLNLMGNCWQFETNKIPYLEFNSVN